MADTTAIEQRFVILAPLGRDAALTAEMLASEGVPSAIARDIAAVVALASEGAAGIMIAEETLTTPAIALLSQLLGAQPAWSDLPVIVFSRKDGGIRAVTERLVKPLGNVIVLDRPIRPIAMLSAVRSAVRARARQYEARTELEEQRTAVRRRDEFLAMLGHELRNPLAAIMMALEARDAGARDPERYLTIVRRQAGHLTRLVDDFLDVSRVTSGKVMLRREPVELCELVRRSAITLESAFRSQRLTLAVDVPAGPVHVAGDPDRLEQVIVNLVTNALKYTPAGGHVRVSVDDEREGFAALRVTDDGVGIASDMLPRIFDLFTQVVGTLDRSKGGLGIGLTLVRSLVELHGGIVAATSAGPGKGTQFTVELPRIVVDVHAEPPPTSRARASEGRAILLVEDNPDNRETLQMLLDADGHQVDAVEDGLSAVDHAVATPPQVMIVDLGLPGIDGYEVARRVRAVLGAGVYLIALTGYGQPEDRRRALEAGFDVHLTKPVDTNRLRSLLGDELRCARDPN